MDTRPEEINVDESLINYADLKRFGENIDKHYASVNSLNAKANVSEVYTRQEVDSKLAGLSAAEGAKGDKGDPGEQGPRGEKGDTGAPGKDGTAGKSAYDIAVENGFAGSEAEWLDSLKGEDVDASNYYNKAEIDQKLAEAAAGGEVDLSGYAKSTELADKADKNEVYTTAAADEKFATKKDIEAISLTPGEQGPEGPAGKDGKDGRDGAAGKSAYDIAVENGFTGTEAEWLDSLKGEKGEAGDGADIDTSAFAKKEDLEGLAKTSDIPDVSGFATKEDIPDVSGLAKASDIPDVSGFAKKEDIPTVPDMSEYAKTSDIPAQKTLAELGGVTQAGVESIIQAKDFTSTDTVRQMIADAIAEALKNNTGGGDTPTPEPDPTPTEPPADGDWAWQKYIVVPASTTLLTTDMDGFFGRKFNHPDEFIGAGEDMKNTTTEFRFIGTLRTQNNNKPAYLIDSIDDLPNGAATIGVDYSKKYKDGMRVPLDGFDDEAKAAFEKALEEENIITTGIMDYDGEAVLRLNCFNVACDQLYMIRTIKEGKIIGDFSLGERIDGKE